MKEKSLQDCLGRVSKIKPGFKSADVRI